MNKISIVILAAGIGTRMKSNVPKVLHKIGNQIILEKILILSENIKKKYKTKFQIKDVLVVIGKELEVDKTFIELKNKYNFDTVLQKHRNGTAGAVSIAMNEINDKNNNESNKNHKIKNYTLLLYGDTPFITIETIDKILEQKNESDVVFVGFNTINENNYGEFIIDENGKLLEIIEKVEKIKKEKLMINKINNINKIKDIKNISSIDVVYNSGIMCVDNSILFSFINQFVNNTKNIFNNNSKNYNKNNVENSLISKNKAKEYYLTDIVKYVTDNSKICKYVKILEQEAMGVNSCKDKAIAEEILQNELRNKMMENGVTLIDPKSTFFSYDTKIGKNCTIYPNVYLGRGVTIGDNVSVLSFSFIEDVEIGNDVNIGPFARIRGKTKIGNKCKVGNFIEIKNSKISSEVSIGHFGYVGDAIIGEKTNVGAGTVFCNYNIRKEKNICKIGKNVFIGSNTELIAPITVGDDAIIGAGTTVTKDVGSKEIAISRVEQKNIKSKR